MKLPCEHRCHEPTFKHAEQQEQPYRGLWQGIVARVDAMQPGEEVSKSALDRWLIELWQQQPDAAQAFALNTTRYGRNVDE